ncbi:MAG: hypothetical protein P4L45_05855 [Ignavibacteriaceae bacterium]|nr:hypothetical protein [Ignavibacteriaceae bacterium]
MNQHLTVLASIIEECNLHIKVIISAYPELKNIIPLNEKTFEKLDNNEIRLLDQFIYRFSLLQDAIGKKLFTALLNSLEHDVNSMQFIDILNKIEALGLITSKAEWIFLVKLREEFSHEFSNDTKENAETINTLFEKFHLVYNTFVKIKDYSLNKFEGLKVNSRHFDTVSFPG